MIEFKLESKVVMTEKDFNKSVKKALEDYTQEVLDTILKYALENLKRNESWVTGNLAKSGRVETTKVPIVDYMEGELIFGAPYAAFVEYGTRPHVAPLGPSLPHEIKKRSIKITSTPDKTTNPLDYWAWRKGKRQAVKTKKYGVHTALGFGVWKKILMRGSDPHPFLRPAIDRVRSEIPQIAKRHGLIVEYK